LLLALREVLDLTVRGRPEATLRELFTLVEDRAERVERVERVERDVVKGIVVRGAGHSQKTPSFWSLLFSQ